MSIGIAGLIERAVDAVLDVHVRVARLDVDVGGARFDRVEDDGVDELDDRRHLGIVREAVQIEHLFALISLLDERGAKSLGCFLQDALRSVSFAQNRVDRAPHGDFDLQRLTQLSAKFIEQREIRRICHRDHQMAVLAAQRHELIAQHQVDRQRLHQRIVDGIPLEIDEAAPVTPRELLRRFAFRQLIDLFACYGHFLPRKFQRLCRISGIDVNLEAQLSIRLSVYPTFVTICRSGK